MYKEYFKEIFQSSKTFIIPGLGSFTKLNDKDINFNPYLKFNDGYLAGFIAKKQGISVDDAGKSIADSVEKIQEALSQKGEALVLGLGVLKKTASGKIEFHTNTESDSKKLEEEIKPKVDTKPSVEIPPIPMEISKPVIEVKPKVEEEVKQKVVEVINPIEIKKIEIPSAKVEIITNEVKVNAPKLTETSTAKNDPKAEKLAKAEEAKKIKLEKEEDAKKAKLAKEAEANKSKAEKEEDAKKLKFAKEEDAKNAKLAKEEANKKAKEAKDEAAQIAKEKKEATRAAKLVARGDKKKRKFPIWLMIVLVLLIGGGTFTALKWEMVKGWIGMSDKSKTEEPKKEIAKTEETKTEPVAEEIIDTTAVVEEQPVVEEVKIEPVKEEKTAPVKAETVKTTNGNFHIITGNFTNVDFATKMTEKLSAEGHQANNLGQRGGFYMVSAGDFSTLEDAKSKLESIKATYPKAYIYNGQ